MTGLPFLISNFMACFVRSSKQRHKLRGSVNFFLYKRFAARIVSKIFNTPIETVKFVRQHTPSRFVCVVNDKYFVKIFKRMSKTKLKNFEFLVNYIIKFMDVKIPKVYIANDGHAYITEKIPGVSIYAFEKEFVLKHEEKILAQVDKIISQLQSIDVRKIQNPKRFCVALESTSKKTKPEPITDESVLAHLDMNVRNFLFDEDLNICGLIDFDSLCITNNRAKDKEIFTKYWERYKKSTRKHPL